MKIRLVFSGLLILQSLLSLAISHDALARTAFESPRVSQTLRVGETIKISLERGAKTAFVSLSGVAGYQIITDKEVLVFGIAPGKASIFILDPQGRTVYSARLNVVSDLSGARDALRKNYPGLDLSLEPAANGAVVLGGRVPDAVTASDVITLVDAFLPRGENRSDANAGGESQGGDGEDDTQRLGRGEGIAGGKFGHIVNRLTIESGGQVTIKVRIAEISRTLRERLGFNWRDLRVRGSLDLALQPSAIIGTLPANLSAPRDLAAVIDVLANENLVSVLAQPNLSVMSGETASFLSGGEVPFPTVDGNGNMTVEYKQYGVLLDVTPTVLSENRISLRIRPEISEPSLSDSIVVANMNVPGLKIRRADTTVEMGSGQSFALAGLLKSDLGTEVAKIPGIGDIPIFGALARSSKFERDDVELVIIATAMISAPTDETLVLPNENLRLTGPISRLFVGDIFVPKTVLPQGFIY